jgi:hypothetical protein
LTAPKTVDSKKITSSGTFKGQKDRRVLQVKMGLMAKTGPPVSKDLRAILSQV